MFCGNCGKQIEENQKFCRYCGVKNMSDMEKEIVEQNYNPVVIHQQATTNAFNRDVLNNYLYNLRILEVAKAKMTESKEEIEYEIHCLGVPKYDKNDTYDGGFDTEAVLWGWGAGLFFFVAAWVVGKLVEWIFGSFFGLSTFVMIISVIAPFVYMINEMVKTGNRISDYESAVERDEKRVKEELLRRKNLMAELEELVDALNNVETLLIKAYSINIIPSKFRGLYPVYFIYDYISTSTSTLNEALFACDLNTIQEKLDKVIEQQREIIMELAYSNALNQQIINQNEQILQQAIQTERNTALAAQYSQVAATNSSVTAYLQVYDFLKN